MPTVDLQHAIDTIIALLIAIDVHELAHALVATWLGDDTPRRAGHLSLNPFRHMDQFGIVMLFITAISGFGFTYGFTPVNDRALRFGPRYGGAIVAAAGPLANLVTGILVVIPYVLAVSGKISASPTLVDALQLIVFINFFLAVFNIIPIPPLDGWKVFSMFLSPRMVFDLRSFVQYGPMVLLLLFVLNPWLHFLSYLSDGVVIPLYSTVADAVYHVSVLV
jgi:Zn-dependent protease